MAENSLCCRLIFFSPDSKRIVQDDVKTRCTTYIQKAVAAPGTDSFIYIFFFGGGAIEGQTNF